MLRILSYVIYYFKYNINCIALKLVAQPTPTISPPRHQLQKYISLLEVFRFKPTSVHLSVPAINSKTPQCAWNRRDGSGAECDEA